MPLELYYMHIINNLNTPFYHRRYSNSTLILLLLNVPIDATPSSPMPYPEYY